MNVLVIPEDPVRDQYILQPIIEVMMTHLGRPRAKIRICQQPRFRGIGHVLKWDMIKAVIERHRPIDLFLLCVDRDGDENRQASLRRLEEQANGIIRQGQAFFAENAWQELEVWLLAGQQDLPRDWNWKAIRAEGNPKEHYFLPYAGRRNVLDFPGEGRGKLAEEAASRYGRIRRLCREDIANLEDRIKGWLANR
ncbi:MAG: hypothetical protein ABS79_03350 [Planctomycetes bacterium SCN 63-9]|mgnify:CR=1 FL=1|nr:MAG: hypothetical protein ABS79_03350 [Planctomycetes bacterium SCN 63-9]